MNGVLPDEGLNKLIAEGAIASTLPIARAQVQPASLDLRLGTVAYRVRASFLAGKTRTVAERLAEFTMHEVDLSAGAVLEKGCVYVVPLLERLDLPAGLSGAASAKSSIGRLDLLT
ncbi:MAG: 2'-deoxycytidine 5'-triphosphate deaminase, partial [Pseudomonadota bacterium]